jgi:hypothetical protein
VAAAVAELLCDFLLHGSGHEFGRLVVYTQNLLLGGVRPTGEKTRFGRRGPPAHFLDAGYIDTFSAEVFEEREARPVVADRADWKDASAEIGEIIERVRAAAGESASSAVAQNEDGSFARDAGDFAGYELIEDEITHKRDRLLGKCGD